MPYLADTARPTLFYRDWGAGRPVLFCSAWALSSVEFQYQMAHLVDRGFRTISFDRRGHGHSDDPGGGYDYDTLADDLAALIEHLDLRDVTLVGHSMGGAEAVRYLRRYGEDRVSGLVLIAAVLPSVARSSTNPQGVDPAAFEQVRDLWRLDYAGWLERNQGPYFGDGLPGCSVSQFMRNWTMNDMLSPTLQAVIDCNRTIVDSDLTQELSAVTVPTLIIQGDHDASIPLEVAGLRQHQLLPNSRLLVYENAPHGLYLTHTERLNRDLAAFVSGNLTVPETAAEPLR